MKFFEFNPLNNICSPNDDIRLNSIDFILNIYEKWIKFDREKYQFDTVYSLITEWLLSNNSEILLKTWHLIYTISDELLNIYGEVCF